MIQSGFQEKYQAEITGITLTYKLIEYGTCFRYMTDYHKHYMLAQRDVSVITQPPGSGGEAVLSPLSPFPQLKLNAHVFESSSLAVLLYVRYL